MSLASYKVLVAKLSDVQQTFNDIWSYVDDLPENATISQMTVRLERLDDLWEKFSEYLIEIKTHAVHDSEKNPYTKERKDFSDRYYHAKAFLLDAIKLKQEPVELNTSARFLNTSGGGNLNHVRLPQIKLQTFSGNI